MARLFGVAKVSRRSISTQSRSAVFNLTNGRCLYCRKNINIDNFHVDHLYPISRGGRNSLNNYVPACSQCNLSKRAKIIVDVDVPKIETLEETILCLKKDIETKSTDIEILKSNIKFQEKFIELQSRLIDSAIAFNKSKENL